ncbi:MAG: hypothetical protein ACOCUS_07300, partial [Polyangiales bacterium]
CEGAVTPGFEACDDVDNDCDGLVDEGALSPCGGCSPGCRGGVWGEGPVPFEADPSAGTGVTDAGELTLQLTQMESSSLWVANSAGATLSKVDTAEAREVARYRSGGSEPSRVAVDYHGDAWVVNRVFEGQPTVRKVAGSMDRCVDRDGDGEIATSSGPDDVLPAGDDECVLLTADVGDPEGVGRAIAIDGDRGPDGALGGHPWIGMHDAEEVIRISGETGEELARVPTPGFRPYTGVFDPWGTLWMISRDGRLARIDRRERPYEAEVIDVPMECFLLYGLASDRHGRLLLTGFACDQVLTYEPRTETWDKVPTPPSTRGAVVQDGVAWVAHTGGRISKLAMAPLALEGTFELAGEGVDPLESIGIATDAMGGVWAASSQGGGDGGIGVASRIDADDGAVSAQVPLGRRPHTQGDMSGTKRFGEFAPEGTATHVFEGCDRGGTNWLALHLAARPGLGTIEVAVRHAESRDALGGDFEVVGVIPDDPRPFELDLPEGGVVEVRLVLRNEARDGAPRVDRVGLEWMCPGPE